MFFSDTGSRRLDFFYKQEPNIANAKATIIKVII